MMQVMSSRYVPSLSLHSSDAFAMRKRAAVNAGSLRAWKPATISTASSVLMNSQSPSVAMMMKSSLGTTCTRADATVADDAGERTTTETA